MTPGDRNPEGWQPESGEPEGEGLSGDPLARVRRATDVRSPQWTMWIGVASLFVVIPLVGWAELRAYAGAHGGPPPGMEAFLLWCIGFGA